MGRKISNFFFTDDMVGREGKGEGKGEGDRDKFYFLN